MMWLYWAIEIQYTWKCQSYGPALWIKVYIVQTSNFVHTHTRTHKKKSIAAGFDHTILVYPSYGTCNQTLSATPTVLEMSVCVS